MKNEYLIFTYVNLALIPTIVIAFFLLLASATCESSKNSESFWISKIKMLTVTYFSSLFHFETTQSKDDCVWLSKKSLFCMKGRRSKELQQPFGSLAPKRSKEDFCMEGWPSGQDVQGQRKEGGHLWGGKDKGASWHIGSWMGLSGNLQRLDCRCQLQEEIGYI